MLRARKGRYPPSPYRERRTGIMTEAVEIEILQAQMEELRDQLDALRIGKVPRGQSKDVSLVAGIKEWIGES